MTNSSPTTPPFLFYSEEGRRICKQIAQRHLPFDPHDYSIDVAARILDGADVLVRTACGGGKTGTIALIAVIMKELGQNPALAPDFKVWYDKDPVILVICPTNALELNIAAKMEAMGIAATALNKEVLTESQNNDSTAHLWTQVKNSRVILLSPELLRSDTVRVNLGLDDPESEFQRRCSVLVCDEAHLIYVWGRHFRKSYGEIGNMRNRLQRKTRLLLLTATLRSGGPLEYVRNSFQLKDGQYIDMHMSNLRPEIRVVTSILQSTLATAFDFPEFRWVLGLPGITIIFAPDRGSALRITLYLRRCNDYLAGSVRKYDAMNDKGTYDMETWNMIRNPDVVRNGLIIVSTTILMVGVDVEGVRRIFNLDPADFDEEIQKEGRLLRNKSEGTVAESYVYVSHKTMLAAHALVEREDAGQGQSGSGDTERSKRQRSGVLGGNDEGPSLDISMARRLLAECRTEEQNRQYGNPPYGQPPCTCATCIRIPLSPNPPCLCSGCQPGMSECDLLAARKDTLHQISADAARCALKKGFGIPLDTSARTHEVITRDSQEIIEKHLMELDVNLFERDIGNPGGLLTPGMFVSRPVISIIVNNFLDLDTPERLAQILSRQYVHELWLREIWKSIRQKIVPAIRAHHEKRQEEAEERRLEVEEMQMLKELQELSPEEFTKLSGHVPILQVDNLDPTVLTKDQLVWELRWHRLWDIQLPKPWKMARLRKDTIVSVLQDAVRRFNVDGRTVEGVRQVLNHCGRT